MKKILISARDLKIGGIEKSLVNLIKYLCKKDCKITLVLEEKKGDLLDQIPKEIKIIQYRPSKNRIRILRKTVNLFKRIRFIFEHGKKYDTSISFATYSKSGAFVARVSSNNSCLWCHADYLSLFNGNKEQVENFFNEIQFYKFSKIVFVSKEGLKNFSYVFPNNKNIYYCNNLIDYMEIYEKAKEKINIKYDENKVTFLNVGRHDEKQKKLSRIIEASSKLRKEGYNFRVIFVGEGEDTEKYKNMVQKYDLKENIIFVRKKINPYPYYKIADAVILSSDYEGYPVVFLESFIMNKPIITTNVSDYIDIENKRGIVTQKNAESIYRAMKKMIEDGYIIKNSFNIAKYNEEVREILKKTIDIF